MAAASIVYRNARDSAIRIECVYGAASLRSACGSRIKSNADARQTSVNVARIGDAMIVRRHLVARDRGDL